MDDCGKDLCPHPSWPQLGAWSTGSRASLFLFLAGSFDSLCGLACVASSGIQFRPGPVEGRDSVRYSCTANIGLSALLVTPVSSRAGGWGVGGCSVKV